MNRPSWWGRRAAVALLVAAGVLTGVQQPAAAAPPLTTPWTAQVSTSNPLPEYPRPQLVRSEWQSLNGMWQFAGTGSIDSPPTGQNLAERVLVPYPIESGLSQIQRHEDRMWYRRTFTVPASWSGRRVQLNFGAVNWEARVWVNGTAVGSHTGAYDPFSLDITGALRAGENEIIVGVWSPVDAAGIPVGKQRRSPGGIFYTAASGIWQSVWIEPVNPARITRLDTTPDVAAGQLDLVVHGAGISGQQVRAEALSGGQVVGTATGAVGAHLRVPVPNARLWTPDDPFLYDLRVTLTGTGGGDTVTGYFGMRSVGKAMVGGVLRPTLNGRFVFQFGTLDQGYWPDGIYTAPTDAALRFDLEQQKALGYNTVRKHVKVEPARWYYWADRLGLMVWQDMPSMRTGVSPSASDRANFESELRRMVDHLRGFPSIVQWVPFNEGWGEYDPARIADLVKGWDPSRLVNNNSGSNCCGFDGGNGDVIDDHIYVGPGNPQRPTATRVAVLGEYGGFGLRSPGHEWPGTGFAYEMAPDAATLTDRYVLAAERLKPLLLDYGLSAAVYTQPTDVENEVNGIWTYDRVVRKMDAARVRAANLGVLAAASGLVPDRLVSLRVTTPGYTDRSLRHQDSLARTDVIAAGSGDTPRQDASFFVRRGLADPACHSFESRNFPGHYLRHSGYRVRKDARDGTALFDRDATFCAREPRAGAGVTLEPVNLPGHFLRHYNEAVYVAREGGPNPWDAPASFAADVTWAVTTPWWRSGANLAEGAAVSLRVTTPGFTDRYLRHQDSLARTDVVTASSGATLKQDATFLVRRGLADGSCYSLESRNFPGHYLRHSDFRVRKDARDGTALFDQDATFCAQPPRAGGTGVALASYNIPGHHVRHFAEAVHIAVPGGSHAFDAPARYDEDVTWAVAPAWAP
ncbi:hypothetical protein HNP84_001307 [Thermocatellispora tengchongensis]|uniref:Beta-galactosidase n=1 Tax=Thermocatellispora tengchongensis TaxID=1073253 RepID=A0A840P130_9ACTN|nr:AbfB domain-containing protein [Thermocatellispora tengchongensis]MBB5131601.1 hypothetical protein [Thermocatellispora tengchongensis]